MVPRPPVSDARRALVRAAFVAAATAVAALAFGLLGGGCSSSHHGPTAPDVIYSSIVISGTDTIAVGGDARYTASVIDAGGHPVASPVLTCTSFVPEAAAMTGSGLVTGAGERLETIQ